MLKQFYFKQFSLAEDQNGPGSDSNEEIHCIPQSSSLTGTSPSDCLVSYPRHSLGGVEVFYPSAEVQSVYSNINTGNFIIT